MQRASQAGFTLIEIMVVVFILGLLVTLVAPRIIGRTDEARVTKAKADIATLENALEQYRLDNLVYPASTDGLNALVTAPPALAQPERYRRGGYIKKLPADPWGRPYNYQAPGPNGKAFDVWSLGADGAPGGTDDNADIRSDN